MRARKSRRIRRPAFDQGQRLDHLAGGSGQYHRLRIAPSRHNFASGVDDHSMPAVLTFQKITAPNLYQPL
jgi:hypothetical protein